MTLFDYPKPFLKWAGGKSQLIPEIAKRLPEEVKRTGLIKNYIEPFIGGGAIYFHLASNFEIVEATLLDINRELVVGYHVVKYEPMRLIASLKELENDYLPADTEKRKEIYYSVRASYNKQMRSFDYEKFNLDWILRAAYLVFLNKTCFNGLFRLNNSGEFNVPIGRYKTPNIVNEVKLLSASEALQKANILHGDFEKAEKLITKNTLVYYDPPYRPISKTASFNKYSKDDFTDVDQRRLAEFYRKMDKKGAFQILSNSDPKNENPKDNFFEELYSKYKIGRVKASRMINCKGEKRGSINELIITNYYGG